MKENKKKSLLEVFSAFEINRVETKFISGGKAAPTCVLGGEETAGSKDTWVDTPSDCGADTDSCDQLITHTLSIR